MKKSAMYALTILGFVLVFGGLFYLKSSIPTKSVIMILPYLCIGIGCGIFGHGMGEIIGSRALKNSPDIQKQMKIEQNDERNMQIANCAKGKAYNAMVYIFGALMLSFSLMNIPIYITLMLVFAYLLVISIYLYYNMKYQKEM